MPAQTACQTATSVSALLNEARAKLGISRHEASIRTKIPERWLSLFEDGGFVQAADDVYSRIYLKAYCQFLGLEIAPVVALYRQERLRVLASQRTASPRRHPVVPVSAAQMVVTPHVIRNTVIVAAAVGLAIYLGLMVKAIVTPPDIDLVSPNDGFVTADRSITVAGRTEREVTVTVNGKTIAADSRGEFRDTLDLQEGLNVIKVVGAKKHSRSSTVIRRVVVEPTVLPVAVEYGPETPPAPLVPAQKTVVAAMPAEPPVVPPAEPTDIGFQAAVAETTPIPPEVPSEPTPPAPTEPAPPTPPTE